MVVIPLLLRYFFDVAFGILSSLQVLMHLRATFADKNHQVDNEMSSGLLLAINAELVESISLLDFLQKVSNRLRLGHPRSLEKYNLFRFFDLLLFFDLLIIFKLVF